MGRPKISQIGKIPGILAPRYPVALVRRSGGPSLVKRVRGTCTRVLFGLRFVNRNKYRALNTGRKLGMTEWRAAGGEGLTHARTVRSRTALESRRGWACREG